MSVEKYISARARFVAVDGEVTELGGRVSAVGRALLQGRARFSFSNTGQGLPMEAMMSRDSVSVDANSWPTPQQIMELLATWHAIRSVVDGAWQILSSEEQSALQPPPAAQR